MIIRKELNGNYTRIPNEFLQNEAISDKARGTLARLLSRPDSWNVNVNHLVKTGKEGHTALRSSLTELEAAGYIHRDVTRGKSGRITGTRYFIFDRKVSPADAWAVADESSTTTETDKAPVIEAALPVEDQSQVKNQIRDTHAHNANRMRETEDVITNKGINKQSGVTTTTPGSVDQESVIEATITSPSSYPAREDINFLVSLVPEQHRKPTVKKLISDALGNHDRRTVEEAVAYATANVKGGWMQYWAYLDKTLQNQWAAGYLQTKTENQTATNAVVVPGGFAGGMPAGKFANGTVTGSRRMGQQLSFCRAG